MTTSHDPSRFNPRQATVLLEGTIQAIEGGLSSRYHANLAQAPGILTDALTAGESRDTAVVAAEAAFTAETAFVFGRSPVRHLNVIPASLIAVQKVELHTGEMIAGTYTPLGVVSEPACQTLITYPDFTEQDVTLALERTRQQDIAGINFNQ